ncbi:MAG TPA: RagB/SusD family nutrient uptake outer membrane protein, partial [Flavitalea sp.]|nr:RagB/SusD family nutrient uptake outer membrane protein [Flavitalea sp.]
LNNVWARGYAAINSANILISQLQNSTVISSSLAQQYIGEAKFIRAFSYLVLVQTFAQPYTKDNGASPGLPLRLAAETSEGNNDLSRSTVAEIYAQIIQDLDDAEAVLPESHGSNTLNSSRAHKATSIALKTRVYLVKGEFANVVTEAKKLVPDASPYVYVGINITHRLEGSISSVFNGSYTGPESIFSLPFNAVDAPDVQSSLAATYYGAVVLALNPAGIVSNPVLSDSSSLDARQDLIAHKNNQSVLAKFTKAAVPYTDYIPVIRYAEVLLNYAEAAAETNDLAKASELLIAVRRRSDPSFVFPPDVLASQALLIDAILTERRIELLGEGFRTPDLQRRVQTLPAKSGAAGTAPAVDPAAGNYIWPLPSDEISTNKLL